MPPGFESRVNTNVVPVQARQGGGVGSAIADGLAQLGQTAGRVADQDAQVQQRIADSDARIAEFQYRRELSAEGADRIGAWAQTQADIANELMDIRTRSKPGAVGHKEEAVKLIRGKMDDFLGTLSEKPELRERFEPMLIEFEARTLLNEGEWEVEKRAKHQGDSWATYTETGGNQLLLDPTPGRFQQFLTDGSEAIELMDVDGTVKAALIDKLKEVGASSFIDGKLQRGEIADVEALVKSGFFNSMGVDIDRTMNRIDTEKRAIAVAQESAMSDARKEARAVIKDIETQVGLGIMPTQAEFAQARAAGKAAGLDDADITSLNGLGLKTALNRQFGPAVDPMGIKASSVVAQLGPKIAAGKASKDEQATYAHLKAVAEASAKSTGAKLKDLAGQGVAGQRQVLEQLRVLPAEQRYMAANEAKSGLGMLSLLGPKTQSFALDGQEVRKARPTDFGEDKEVKAAFARRVGGVGAMMGGQYDDTLNTAWNIYAGALNAKGRKGWDQAEFDNAVKLATGATLRGDGAMQGGIGRVRGYQVQLPDWKTPAEFDATLSSLKFAGAIYKDGRAASKADVLANYRPEYYGDDANGNPRYRFVDARGNLLGHKDGIFDIVVQR